MERIKASFANPIISRRTFLKGAAVSAGAAFLAACNGGGSGDSARTAVPAAVTPVTREPNIAPQATATQNPCNQVGMNAINSIESGECVPKDSNGNIMKDKDGKIPACERLIYPPWTDPAGICSYRNK